MVYMQIKDEWRGNRHAIEIFGCENMHIKYFDGENMSLFLYNIFIWV